MINLFEWQKAVFDDYAKKIDLICGRRSGKLASQSAQSSYEIDEILKQLVKNYEIIIQNVKSTSDNMEVQNGKLVETQNVFAVLEKEINF